jgi:hypothetical protein
MSRLPFLLLSVSCAAGSAWSHEAINPLAIVRSDPLVHARQEEVSTQLIIEHPAKPMQSTNGVTVVIGSADKDAAEPLPFGPQPLVSGSLVQQGEGNTIHLTVSGSYSNYELNQLGWNNQASGRIAGTSNQAVVTQVGSSNIAAFQQSGSGNSVAITQR